MSGSPANTGLIALSIIIVNWNSKDYLQRCVASIVTQPTRVPFEIVVVDSGSFDGCDAMLRQFFPHVRFIQSRDNIGFAAANNLGVEAAFGETLLFLNPDTEVGEGVIDHLYEILSASPDVGILGPRLLNTDGSLQTSCVQVMPTILNQLFDFDILQRRFPNWPLWRTAAALEGQESPVEVEALSGACMIARREAFVRIGGFCTDYFMYAEDIDLCWKARRAGYRNFYDPGANVVHHGGGSTQRGRSHFHEVMIPESLSRLLCKTHGRTYSVLYRIALSASAVVRILLLGLSLPAGCLTRKTRRWTVMLKKWSAILRWGLGMESWVKKFGRPG
jgi:GT2 family glycosyltransferase